MPENETEDRPRRRLRWPLSRQRMVELGVVVFGVTIALGLENVIEEVRIRSDARALERAFREDILLAVSLSWERELIAPCLAERLKVLSERVATPGGVIEPLAPVAQRDGAPVFATPQAYRAPVRVWVTSSFDRALGSEAFKRIPRERADAYAVLFTQIASMRETNSREYLDSAGLAPLAYAQPDMDAQVRADLLTQINLLDRHQLLARVEATQVIRSALNLPGGEDIRRAVLDRRQILEGAAAETRAVSGACVDLRATERLMNLARNGAELTNGL